jgi:LacI family transcriptional regulator
MPNLREVARAADVSVSTASRVLNGSDHPVSSEIQERVRAAAASLGYTASAAARALKQQRSKIIGVIAADILDPYFAEMTRGVELEATRHGYVTIIANANRDPEQERTKFRVLREHQASGIIFCGSDIEGAKGTDALAAEVTAAIAEGTKVIALAPRHFEATRLVIDNERAGNEITRHLLSLGHKDIVFLGGIPGLSAVDLRTDGYRRAMEEAALEPRVAGTDGLSQESGRAAAELMVQASLPDAIICANDEVALGVIACFWKAGVRVPEDVSLAGIGGTRVGSNFDLTSVVLPLADQGRLAARYIAKAEDRPEQEAPAPTLRLGGTSAAKASRLLDSRPGH